VVSGTETAWQLADSEGKQVFAVPTTPSIAFELAALENIEQVHC